MFEFKRKNGGGASRRQEGSFWLKFSEGYFHIFLARGYTYSPYSWPLHNKSSKLGILIVVNYCLTSIIASSRDQTFVNLQLKSLQLSRNFLINNNFI